MIKILTFFALKKIINNTKRYNCTIEEKIEATQCSQKKIYNNKLKGKRY